MQGENIVRRMANGLGGVFLALPWMAVAVAAAYSVKPNKLPEFKNFASPPPFDPPKKSKLEAKPVAAPKFELRTVNGKLVVDADSAPRVVNKILEIKAKYPNNCMAQAFDKAYYDTLPMDKKIRLLTICLSGVANEDSEMGCYAMNPRDYDDFKPFFSKALQQYHRVDLSKKKHRNNNKGTT